ncbi:MAG TPA: hypothetical protein VFQ53_30975 [Kofleriaceae bacterium]|nr:hypothetical protein [Kofleriaceae bacterium]
MPVTWIAEQPLVFIHADGTRETARIAVGLPETVSDEEAACAIVLEPLLPKPYLIKGASKLQALALAIRFVSNRLSDAIDDGTRIEFADGRSVVLDELFGA